MPTMFRESRPRARKVYYCDECGALIPIGLRYWTAFGVWDGEPSTWRTHAHCAAFRSRYNDHLTSVKGYSAEECAPFGFVNYCVQEGSEDAEWAKRWARLKAWTHKRYGGALS